MNTKPAQAGAHGSPQIMMSSLAAMAALVLFPSRGFALAM